MSDLYLVRTTVRDLVRPKKLAVAGLLVVIPALLVLIARLGLPSFDPAVAYNMAASRLVFGILLVLVALVTATGVVTQEIEGRTIVYLLTRPVPRWRILLAKFVPALVAIVLVSWVAVTLVGVVAMGASVLSKPVLYRDYWVLAVGTFVYASLFLLLATLMDRPIILGLIYAFGWESWVAAVPGQFQKLSLMAYLQALAPHPAPEGDSISISAVFGAFNPATISPGLAKIVLVLAATVTFALALVVFSNREYVPKNETG